MDTGYEKVFDELNNELTELEAKPFYDLFKKLYCSNYSLRNELEQVSRRYYKLHELVNDKRQLVEKLYELLQLLKRPEVKILSLLKHLEGENIVPLEKSVVQIFSSAESIGVEDIYKEFDKLVEKLKDEDINLDVLEFICKPSKIEGDNIILEELYWRILKNYYYNLRDGTFMQNSLSKIKDELLAEGVVSSRYSRLNLMKDLRKVRKECYIGKKK